MPRNPSAVTQVLLSFQAGLFTFQAASWSRSSFHWAAAKVRCAHLVIVTVPFSWLMRPSKSRCKAPQPDLAYFCLYPGKHGQQEQITTMTAQILQRKRFAGCNGVPNVCAQ